MGSNFDAHEHPTKESVKIYAVVERFFFCTKVSKT